MRIDPSGDIFVDRRLRTRQARNHLARLLLTSGAEPRPSSSRRHRLIARATARSHRSAVNFPRPLRLRARARRTAGDCRSCLNDPGDQPRRQRHGPWRARPENDVGELRRRRDPLGRWRRPWRLGSARRVTPPTVTWACRARGDRRARPCNWCNRDQEICGRS